MTINAAKANRMSTGPDGCRAVPVTDDIVFLIL